MVIHRNSTFNNLKETISQRKAKSHIKYALHKLYVQNMVEVSNDSGLFKANHAIGQWRVESWPAVTFSILLLYLL